jgi:uncharacterized protein
VAIVDLDRLALSSGQGRRLDVPVMPGEIELGGQDYASVPASVEVRLDVSRTSSGHALRLRLPLRLEGPCMRCLEPAALSIEIDSREIDQPISGDEEMLSPYVSEGLLDVGRWAHDAVALALPVRITCRENCLGLCTVCGESLNDADPEVHRHNQGGDPRWAKLRDLDI